MNLIHVHPVVFEPPTFLFSSGGPPLYFQTGIRCLLVLSLPVYRYSLEFRHYLHRSFIFEFGFFHQSLIFNLLEGSVI